MSKDSLLFLSDLLTSHPTITIDLFSHTDSRSSARYNQVLSENRAKAVYKFLVEEKGIDPRRIQPIGKGEAEPATWTDENGQEVVLTEKISTNLNLQIKQNLKCFIKSTEERLRASQVKILIQKQLQSKSDWMKFKPLK